MCPGTEVSRAAGEAEGSGQHGCSQLGFCLFLLVPLFPVFPLFLIWFYCVAMTNGGGLVWENMQFLIFSFGFLILNHNQKGIQMWQGHGYFRRVPLQMVLIVQERAPPSTECTVVFMGEKWTCISTQFFGILYLSVPFRRVYLLNQICHVTKLI